MKAMLHATKALLKRRIQETFISPGVYITQSISLFLAYFLIQGFIKSIGSSGFNPQLHPLYDLIDRLLQGAFGTAFSENIFSEGPFVFALHICFIPMLIYLSISSTFRFGLDKKIGALALFTFGPANATSYFLSALIKDIIMTLLHLLVLILFFVVCASSNNLVIGPMFFFSISLLFFLSISIFAYATMASTSASNPTSAVGIFVGIMILFLTILVGSFTIITGYVQTYLQKLATIINWISCFSYWSEGLRAADAKNWIVLIINLVLQLILSLIVITISHFIIKLKGVRP